MENLVLYENWQPSDGNGEYSIEEMDEFLRELFNTIEWSSEDVQNYKKVTVNLPSNSGRNVSTISTSKEEAIEHWEEALERYGKDKNTKFYVWNAKVGGSLNKPKKFSTQRFDIDSIREIFRKYPNSVHKLSVSFDSDEQDSFGKMMTKDYYNGKPGNYTGD